MADSRQVAETRERIFTLKLTAKELKDLQWLAERKFRRPGDQLRLLLSEAVATERTLEKR